MLDIYRNKRVFITGHSGFKGSWISLWLERLGAETCGYSLLPHSNPSHFDMLGGKKRFRSIFADIGDKDLLQKSLLDFKPDIIFHLAAQPLVRESYKNPIYTFSTNALGTLNVLECARSVESVKAIVVITTDKVYENKEWIWGYRENDALGGYDVYSASKACAEIITSAMQRSFFSLESFAKTHNCLIATARAGNVIGGGDFSEDRIVPDLIRGVLSKTPTTIRNPKATRPWQFVLEPLRGYLLLGSYLLNQRTEFATSFNFAPNIEANLSVESLLKQAKICYSKIDYKIKRDSANPHEANLLMLDSTKAYCMLGFKSLYNIQDSIKHTISWYKEYCENGKIISEKQLESYSNAIKANNALTNGGGAKRKRKPLLIFVKSSDFVDSSDFIELNHTMDCHDLTSVKSRNDNYGAIPHNAQFRNDKLKTTSYQHTTSHNGDSHNTVIANIRQNVKQSIKTAESQKDSSNSIESIKMDCQIEAIAESHNDERRADLQVWVSCYRNARHEFNRLNSRNNKNTMPFIDSYAKIKRQIKQSQTSYFPIPQTHSISPRLQSFGVLKTA